MRDILLISGQCVAFISAVYFYTRSQQELFKESEDWKSKYKEPLEPSDKNWYTDLFNLKYKERFFLSGSFLVALTDNYHKYQLFFKLLLCVSIVLYRPLLGWWDALILFVLWGVTFTVVFRR